MSISLAFEVFAEIARYTEGIFLPSREIPQFLSPPLQLVEVEASFNRAGDRNDTIQITCRAKDPENTAVLLEVAQSIRLFPIEQGGRRLAGVSFPFATGVDFICATYRYGEDMTVLRLDVDVVAQ